MHIYDNSCEYIPYTYLIGWSKLDKWYYGSQTSLIRKAHPSNLWTIYYTSSNYVKKFRELHGEPDVVQVRRTFKDRRSALMWEHKVLKKLKAHRSSRWLNQSVGGPTFFCVRCGDENPSKRDDVRQKISKALSGRVFNAKHRNNIRTARLGYNKGQTYEEIYGDEKASQLKTSRSNTHKGKTTPEHVIQLMRDRASKWWRIYPPNGEPIIVQGLPDYCKDHNLDVSTLFDTAKRPYNNDGKLRYHKGYRAELLQSDNATSTSLQTQIEPIADKKTKLYQITWPCGKIEKVRGLGEFARLQGWPDVALYDVKDKFCANGEPRKYRGFIVKTISGGRDKI